MKLSILNNMKPITEYEDYRQYMRDFYEERKKVSSFTWREFAKLAGFSSSGYLKLVCDGSTRLSQVGAVKVAMAMELVGFHQEYFLYLVKFCDALSEKIRMDAFAQMQKLAKENKVHVVGMEAFDYYKSWVNPVVRELAPVMPSAKPSDIAKMCVPEATVGEVRNSLTLMEKLGILEKDDDGNYKQVNKGISGDVTAISAALRALQKQMAQLASDASEMFSKDERNISGITFGIDEEAYVQIVDEINIFKNKIKAIVSNVKKYNRVYRLNLQVFPLSKKVDEYGK